MNTQDKVKVMQAWLDGKPIEEYRSVGKCPPYLFGPGGASSEPVWDFVCCTYRIKPEPREWRVFIDEKSGHIYENGWLPVGAAQIKVREVIE